MRWGDWVVCRVLCGARHGSTKCQQANRSFALDQILGIQQTVVGDEAEEGDDGLADELGKSKQPGVVGGQNG